jgi:hypothetical protein
VLETGEIECDREQQLLRIESELAIAISKVLPACDDGLRV